MGRPFPGRPGGRHRRHDAPSRIAILATWNISGFGQPTISPLIAATESWIRRYKAVLSFFKDRYPTAHDTVDEEGRPFFSAEKRAAIEGGAPYVAALDNVILFSGPDMRRYDEGPWQQIKSKLGLTGFDAIGPTSDGAMTIDEEIDHLEAVRDGLKAMQPAPDPDPIVTTPVAKKLPRRPPKRVFWVVMGLLTTAGVTYAAVRANR